MFARLTLLAALLIGAAQAQTLPTIRDVGPEAPRSAIYLGNSFFYYNNSLHGHVSLMQRAAGMAAMRATSITISGAGWEWHDVASYFRPNALGSYSFDARNNIVFNTNARLFDLAIMMDCSQCPIHPRLGAVFHDYARRHSETVRAHGARPVFFMSWAYKDAPEMTAQLAEAYTVAGNANDALVIPAGLAFARSMAERPGLDLYVPDLRHPSLAGTYLAAATSFATLTGRSPIGNSYDAGLGAETAAFLQRMAWETVQGYFGAGRRASN